MARLTEPMIIARSKCSDLNSIKKLNCWGNELSDVSMVQRMTNVEILVLSVNSIKTLADFQHCNKLRELHLRKNEIASLNEVCYLQYLPQLKILNLSDNPCTKSDTYRLTVVRALPLLEKLDDQEVSEEERRTAGRQGRELIHPDEAESAWQQDSGYQYHEQQISNGVPAEVSPNQTPPEMNSPEPQRFYHEEYAADRRNANYDSSPTEQIGYSRTSAGGSSSSYQPASQYTQQQSYQQQGYQQQSPTNLYAEILSPPDPPIVQQRRLRENPPPNSCKPPSPTIPAPPSCNGGIPPCEAERGPRCRADGEARLCSDLPCAHQDDDYCRPVPQHVSQVRHRYTSSQPPPPTVQTSSNLPRKSRTSNILSAVLCLLKELDYHSLEVVDTTVNARMNELMHEHDA